jgi:hypothetical protein
MSRSVWSRATESKKTNSTTSAATPLRPVPESRVRGSTVALGSAGKSDSGITFWFGYFSVLFWVRDKTGLKGKDGWQLFAQDGRLGLELNGVEYFPDENDQPDIADGRWHLIAASVEPYPSIGPQAATISVYSETKPNEWTGAFFFSDPEMKFSSAASIRIGGAIQRQPFRGCYDEVQLGRWMYSFDEMGAIFKARTYGQEK